MSDFRIFTRGAPVRMTKPEHPLAHCKADEEIHSRQFQSLGCGHCGRVYQNETWVWRCGKCTGKTILFGACEDCGGPRAAHKRYDDHQRGMHEPRESR